jgi:hypothetical protein
VKTKKDSRINKIPGKNIHKSSSKIASSWSFLLIKSRKLFHTDVRVTIHRFFLLNYPECRGITNDLSLFL